MSAPHSSMRRATFSALLLALALRPCKAQESLFRSVISHPYLVTWLYSDPSRFSSPPSATGAISVNQAFDSGAAAIYYIEQQRYVANWVIAGVVVGADAHVDVGISIASWGFARQAADASGGGFPGSGDPVHSASLFLEGAARAALALRAFGKRRSVVADWTPRLVRGARNVTHPDTTARGRDVNLDPFAHRFFLRAAAAQMAAALAGGDVDLEARAKALVEEGMARQDARSGVLPERGGFDFNYQVLSVALLARYYLFIIPGSAADAAAFRARVVACMGRALAPVRARVDGLGNIDLSDSSRIAELGRNGRAKTLDLPNIYLGLVAACAVTADPAHCALRDVVVDPPLIVGYSFDEQENGIKSVGKDTYGVLYARTRDNGRDLTPNGVPRAGGVVADGAGGDYAYNLRDTDEMGRKKGQLAYTRYLASLDGLRSFTLSGWFRTAGAKPLGYGVDLLKTKKFRLRAVGKGQLRLHVDSESKDDSVTSAKKDWAKTRTWMHFAVSYDGTKTAGNVKFYFAERGARVQLSSTQTLDRGAVDEGGPQRLYVSHQSHPFHGLLDNMRVHGSKVDASGALTVEQLNEQMDFDFHHT